MHNIESIYINEKQEATVFTILIPIKTTVDKSLHDPDHYQYQDHDHLLSPPYHQIIKYKKINISNYNNNYYTRLHRYENSQSYKFNKPLPQIPSEIKSEITKFKITCTEDIVLLGINVFCENSRNLSVILQCFNAVTPILQYENLTHSAENKINLLKPFIINKNVTCTIILVFSEIISYLVETTYEEIQNNIKVQFTSSIVNSIHYKKHIEPQ